MPKTNRLGLSRDIPTKIKKIVRRRVGFGCVICGNAIITYEHFDPPYKDAKTHEPKGITLLCGSHQLEASKGLLAKKTIAEHNRNPYCITAGYSKHIFNLGGLRPSLFLGSNSFEGSGNALVLADVPIISIRRPENGSRLWRLSAIFQNNYGEIVCRIVDNEIQVMKSSFDFVQTAQNFTVYDGDTIVVELQLQESSIVIIKKLQITVAGQKFFISGDEFRSEIGTSVNIHNVSFTGRGITALRNGGIALG